MVDLMTYETHEQLIDFISYVTQPGKPALPDSEIPAYMHYYMIGVSMTRLKLAGIIWFDEEIYPIVPAVETKISFNPDARLEDTKEKTSKYKGMTLTVLSQLASRLKKPEWTEDNATQ